jgi:hypothetical protein
MKAIFAYNFNKPPPKMNKPTIAKNENTPVFGGPSSAFSPYKVHDEVNLPNIRTKRKDAFRTLKALFGVSEPVGVTSSDPTSASQK